MNNIGIKPTKFQHSLFAWRLRNRAPPPICTKSYKCRKIHMPYLFMVQTTIAWRNKPLNDIRVHLVLGDVLNARINAHSRSTVARTSPQSSSTTPPRVLKWVFAYFSSWTVKPSCLRSCSAFSHALLQICSSYDRTCELSQYGIATQPPSSKTGAGKPSKISCCCGMSSARQTDDSGYTAPNRKTNRTPWVARWSLENKNRFDTGPQIHPQWPNKLHARWCLAWSRIITQCLFHSDCIEAALDVSTWDEKLLTIRNRHLAEGRQRPQVGVWGWSGKDHWPCDNPEPASDGELDYHQPL